MARRLGVLLILASLALFRLASAQSGEATRLPTSDATAVVIQLAEKYPANSIDSTGRSDQALQEVSNARAMLEMQFAHQERACYAKFFTNACIDEAKEKLRSGRAALRPIELEASAFQRRVRVEQREQALAEKQAKGQATASEREVSRQDAAGQAAIRAEQRASQQQDRQANPGAGESVPDNRAEQHREKLKRLEAQEALKEPQRAKNIAAYQEKVLKAQQRQKELAEKRARKAQENANNAIKQAQ